MSGEPQKAEKAGIPAWVMTFADLMTLLMCFFVLLLSFAEMDLIKFKQVAGSMRQAFGVQQETPSDSSERELEFTEGQVSDEPLFEKIGEQDSIDPKALDPQTMEKLLEEMQAKETKAEALKLAALLSEEITAGAIELESTTDSIIIRINEKASFPSGRAKLRPGFVEILDKIRSALTEVEGTVTVAGHTDNRPIRTSRFRSNWELSTGRAVSVLHALLRSGLLQPERFLVEGHGDARPLAPNDTSENRARNRRVELTINMKKTDDELVDPEDTLSDSGEAKEANSPEASPLNPENLLPETDVDFETSPAVSDLVLPGEDKPLLESNGAEDPVLAEPEYLQDMDAPLPELDSGQQALPPELEQLLRDLDAAAGNPSFEEELNN